MSVLLFMPESGGCPLESIILTSHDEGDGELRTNDNYSHNNSNIPHHHHHPEVVSRFDMENGQPVRRMSSDSVSSWSEHEDDEDDGGCIRERTCSGERREDSCSPRVRINPDTDTTLRLSDGSAQASSTSLSLSSSRRWRHPPRSSRLSLSTSSLLTRDEQNKNKKMRYKVNGHTSAFPTIDVYSGILV